MSLLAVSFLAGFANLALEVLCPRVLSTLFGSTNILWAAGITTTLGGLACGYWLGGLVAGRARGILCAALLAAALGIAAAQAICGWVAGAIGEYSVTAIFATAFAALFPTSVCLGMVPPLVIERLAGQSQRDRSHVLGRVLALGTIGSLCGAWFAAFPGVQSFGIEASLRLVSIALVAVALLSSASFLACASIAALVLFLRPAGGAGVLTGFDLLRASETSYQSVRVYAARDRDEVLMAFGPSCQSLFDRATHSAASPYARVMSSIVELERPHKALIVGGAGNALAIEMERRGIDVTVIELDPAVVQLTSEYFAAIHGETIVADGRAAVRWRALPLYDLVLVDAFSGPGIIPPHLVTLEGLREFRAKLTPGGLFAINVHATPSGPATSVFAVLSSTLQAAFGSVNYWPVQEYSGDSRRHQNVWFLASDRALVAYGMPCPAPRAQVARDDLNPLEQLMFEEQDGQWSGARLEDIAASLAR